ncbi:MAG TPA: hypothetical protein VJ698_05730 [Noviherbaspirillum sp.]|uniref:hypothetical protein n=1 Tax=Noviherbaspirillum sp. TaxID=1926288 RepID=UPI002B47AE96|nr:hypothetical protein [Noviherbaspirillum sp.]HJV84955.1 hypothetical protein [Noviherbaspirillum sp.]
MNKDSSMKIDRSAGAEVISAMAVAVGAKLGVAVSGCVWDMGADLSHEYAHRLEISTATNTVRVYFPDLDLTTSGNTSRKEASRQERIEDRLHRAVTQLVTRVPAPTYMTS